MIDECTGESRVRPAMPAGSEVPHQRRQRLRVGSRSSVPSARTGKVRGADHPLRQAGRCDAFERGTGALAPLGGSSRLTRSTALARGRLAR